MGLQLLRFIVDIVSRRIEEIYMDYTSLKCFKVFRGWTTPFFTNIGHVVNKAVVNSNRESWWVKFLFPFGKINLMNFPFFPV